MVRDRNTIAHALGTKGFVLKQGDHQFFHFMHNGRKTAVFTMLSRGTAHRTLSNKILGKIRRQLHLNRSQFEDFAACPLSESDYRDHLIAKGTLKE